MNETPKGQTVPQTIENLQKIMAADAVTMEEMGREISLLKRQNQSLRVLNSAPYRTVQRCPIRTIYKSMTYGIHAFLAGLRSTTLGTKPHKKPHSFTRR